MSPTLSAELFTFAALNSEGGREISLQSCGVLSGPIPTSVRNLWKRSSNVKVQSLLAFFGIHKLHRCTILYQFLHVSLQLM